jgi:hypothetical protein
MCHGRMLIGYSAVTHHPALRRRSFGTPVPLDIARGKRIGMQQHGRHRVYRQQHSRRSSAVSKNPRNIDRDDLGETRGGIGTHATNRNQAAAAERDNRMVGREGHRADPMAAAGHGQQHGDANQPMTADQAARLRILSAEAAEPFDQSLDRLAADQRIDELQRQAGRKP